MLTFQLPRTAVFAIIDQSAEAAIRSYRQLGHDEAEAGGVFIGSMHGESFRVSMATTPQEGDIRSRYRFFRQEKGHQEFVNNAWLGSNGVLNYVGEWHTHPEDYPHPSLIDRVGWSFRSSTSRKCLLVMIVGRMDYFVAIQSRLKLLPMVKISPAPT